MGVWGFYFHVQKYNKTSYLWPQDPYQQLQYIEQVIYNYKNKTMLHN